MSMSRAALRIFTGEARIDWPILVVEKQQTGEHSNCCYQLIAMLPVISAAAMPRSLNVIHRCGVVALNLVLNLDLGSIGRCTPTGVDTR